jgi:HD-GYP domain-containing protein (c-di-GMP phosphodiesterase class II)
VNPDTYSFQQVLERANQAAAVSGLVELIENTLGLLVDICRARAGLFYLFDHEASELICLATFNLPDGGNVLSQRVARDRGEAGASLRQGEVLFIEDISSGQAWRSDVEELRFLPLSNVLNIPFLLDGHPICVAQLFDCHEAQMEMLPFLTGRLASEIHKAILLESAQQHAERMDAMISIFEKIGSTLDRDRLLRMMIEYAREVINAEACSLFLVDENTRENVLHLASNINAELSLEQMRVPPGMGIIGHVVESGEEVLVPDVTRDERHYRQVDKSSGFVTRAILAVPLRTRTVILGEERGVISTRLIGGFEAINKVIGTFDDQDAGLLTTLANQAATVLQIADLYGDANELFLDVIKALAAAVDAKDPYTEGHSQRVSDFSVEIARQLALPGEMVHRVRIGSLLHDVGKIGIPDHILVKPGVLTENEYEVMKQHATIGANIMGKVRKLHNELPALAEHHERLDGSGYPHGLKGDQVSLMGRIVAAADVFDAMTSDRPYRSAMPVEEVLDYLFKGINTRYDGECVNALAKAHIKELVKTQKEREKLTDKSGE